MLLLDKTESDSMVVLKYAKLNGATAFNDDYITVYPSASMTFSPNEKSISDE
jgi:hypothetical protein